MALWLCVPGLAGAASLACSADNPEPGAAPAVAFNDAGEPFGSAIAVGDFDDDGCVDVAVAERAGPSASSLEIRVAFANGESRALEAGNGHAMLRLDSTDVDDDGDADLRVADALTGQTLDVWVNAGDGEFSLRTPEIGPGQPRTTSGARQSSGHRRDPLPASSQSGPSITGVRNACRSCTAISASLPPDRSVLWLVPVPHAGGLRAPPIARRA